MLRGILQCPWTTWMHGGYDAKIHENVLRTYYQLFLSCFHFFSSVKPLIDLVETTRRVGSTKFAKLLESSNFVEELRSGPPLTLFVPSDEAFEVCQI